MNPQILIDSLNAKDSVDDKELDEDSTNYDREIEKVKASDSA